MTMVLGFWSWENLYTAKQPTQKIGRKQYQIYFGPWPTVASKESSLKRNSFFFNYCFLTANVHLMLRTKFKYVLIWFVWLRLFSYSYNSYVLLVSLVLCFCRKMIYVLMQFFCTPYAFLLHFFCTLLVNGLSLTFGLLQIPVVHEIKQAWYTCEILFKYVIYLGYLSWAKVHIFMQFFDISTVWYMRIIESHTYV